MRILLSLIIVASSGVAQAQTSSCSSGSVLSMPPSTPTERFTIPADESLTSSPVIIDKQSGLMWARCETGKTWDPQYECIGTAALKNWQETLAHIESTDSYLGYAGWRVPNVKELTSIVERRCLEPSLNSDVFASGQATILWTNSPIDSNSTSSVWTVDFAAGTTQTVTPTSSYGFRLVRDCPDAECN